MTLLVEELSGLPSPGELFARISPRRGSWLFETSRATGAESAYSFIGFEPFMTMRAKHGIVETTCGTERVRFEGDALKELRRLLLQFRTQPCSRFPFCGGAVGYLSYEFGASLESIARKAADDPSIPDIEFGFYDGALVFEHASSRWFAVANPVHAVGAEDILRRLRAAAAASPGAGLRRALEFPAPRPTHSREDYIAAVERIKAYIASGDVYQVNLAQRFECPMPGDAYNLYLRLRDKSPAPYACYLSTSFGQIVSCSPERFLRVRGREVETRPIKGTRPRGSTPEEDQRLADELMSSAKERAELLMIVDLERNDLGRVCTPGSIRVDRLYEIEAHPTVFHLVATVRGTLAPDRDTVDLLRATFPGGSITGAPKIRAMQIIDEVEPVRRHVYTGSIGYLGFDGNCDLNIAIRTITCAGGVASYHVGAGIVWDSDPAAEYEETLAKGKALFEALTSAADPKAALGTSRT
jgi:para-aminobenzoate synthetase component I